MKTITLTNNGTIYNSKNHAVFMTNATVKKNNLTNEMYAVDYESKEKFECFTDSQGQYYAVVK